jgi:GAF domain-containing protein
LLVYAPEASVWIWDVDHIQGKGYTDNVVDLMIGKLNRFPQNTQASLKQLACLGHSADIAVFSMVYGEPENRVDAAMWDALRGGLVSRSQQTYTFVHDRVQEAAYALIPDGERATVHLRIGRALTTHMETAEIEEKIFEIVNQLILLRGSEPLIEAEVTTGHGRVDVHVRQTVVTPSDLPNSALHCVIRTQHRVVLDDASARNSYSDDQYLEQRKAKSVLCLPIVKQTKLIGVLYLENNLTPRVFTSGRVAVLDMLVSQAAISLENARLYAALEQENLERKRAEEELRRSETYLAEAQKLSCTGSFGWSIATDEHFWSEET